MHLNNVHRSIPILAGTVTEEGLVLSAPFHRSQRRWDFLFRHWDTYAPQAFFGREADFVTEEDRETVAEIRRKYFSGEEDRVPAHNESNLRGLERAFSAAVFRQPLRRDLELLRKHGAERVHTYSFGYEGSMTIGDVFRLSLPKMMINFTGRFLGAK